MFDGQRLGHRRASGDSALPLGLSRLGAEAGFAWPRLSAAGRWALRARKRLLRRTAAILPDPRNRAAAAKADVEYKRAPSAFLTTVSTCLNDITINSCAQRHCRRLGRCQAARNLHLRHRPRRPHDERPRGGGRCGSHLRRRSVGRRDSARPSSIPSTTKRPASAPTSCLPLHGTTLRWAQHRPRHLLGTWRQNPSPRVHDQRPSRHRLRPKTPNTPTSPASRSCPDSSIKSSLANWPSPATVPTALILRGHRGKVDLKGGWNKRANATFVRVAEAVTGSTVELRGAGDGGTVLDLSASTSTTSTAKATNSKSNGAAPPNVSSIPAAAPLQPGPRHPALDRRPASIGSKAIPAKKYAD